MVKADGQGRSFYTLMNDVKPIEMHTNAGLLLEDCTKLLKSQSSGPYILMAHAIELLLKAYLHKQGVSLDHLRKKYQHGLPELLKDARAKGLIVSDPDADDFIGRLAVVLDKAALRYEFGYSNLPLVPRLLSFAQALSKDVDKNFS